MEVTDLITNESQDENIVAPSETVEVEPHEPDEHPAAEDGDSEDHNVAEEGQDDVSLANPTAAELEAMIAEAEQRGYLRGRNEQIEELMKQPEMYEREPTGEGGSAATEVLILNNLRRSVWD